MAKGKDYELFIEKLYRELEPNATIVQDDFICGYETNSKRQIDVSIRNNFLGKEYLTIVQAKDHSRRADVNKVGEFLSVVKDVRANKGILICSRGFTKKAVEYGRNMGLELLTLHSARNKNWTTLFQAKIKKVTHFFDIDANITVNIKDLAGKTVRFDSDIFSTDKKNIYDLLDIVDIHLLRKRSWKDIVKRKPIRLSLRDIILYIYIDEEFRLVDHGYVEIRYLRSKTETFFVDPEDYVIEVNHVSGQQQIHNVVYNTRQLETMMKDDFVPSPSTGEALEKGTDLEIVISNYANAGSNNKVRFFHKGAITGESVYNEAEGIIIPVNESNKRRIEVLHKIAGIRNQ